jgi:hypothetical protein
MRELSRWPILACLLALAACGDKTHVLAWAEHTYVDPRLIVVSPMTIQDGESTAIVRGSEQCGDGGWATRKHFDCILITRDRTSADVTVVPSGQSPINERWNIVRDNYGLRFRRPNGEFASTVQ